MMPRSRFAPAALRALLAALLLATLGIAQSPAPKGPPETRVAPVVEELHGVKITDPYRWLEDDKAPQTRAWIDAQNAYTRSRFAPLPTREPLRKLLEGLLKVDVVGTPTERKGTYFFSKRRADQDLFVLYMRKGLDGADEVLLDPHPLSPDHTVSITVNSISDDGSLLVYGLRRGGEDEVELRVLDVKTKRTRPDHLPRARYGSVALLPDNSGLFYSRLGSQGSRVYFHKLGSDPADDPLVFGEGYGPDKIIASGISEDGRYQVFYVGVGSAATRSEIYLRDLKEAPDRIVPVVKDIDAPFFPSFAGDTLLLNTTWEAPRGRVFAVDPQNPAREHWRELIPESDAVIEGLNAVGGKLFVAYSRNALRRLHIFTADGEPAGEVEPPAVGVIGGMSGRWSSREGFFSFSSFHTPSTIYRYEIAGGKRQVWSRLEVPIRSEDFEVRQVWYTSKDGTRVPMFVAHRKGIKLDGSNPTLLHGYGGFNAAQTPSYSVRPAAWLQLGGVYALANLRGGSEFGEEWHRAGMLEKKQNVFDDFIAAGEWLIAKKYTSKEKLAISGGSNGGLLVGAALTQRPDLFRAVLCFYPLLDMVRYHKFSIARFWVPEYGSAEDPEQFRYIHAYSPYHNVKKGTKYPAVLLVTGDADTRVVPLHARKMTALLQASTGSDRPILLRYDTKAGHIGGVAPVPVQVEELTDQLSFLLWQLEADWPPES